MKTAIFAILFCISLTATSQTRVAYVKNDMKFVYTVVNERPAGPSDEEPYRISVVSPNRDTLWLVDEPIGHLIASTWDTDPLPNVKKPVIIFVKELPVPSAATTASKKQSKRKGKRIKTNN